MCGSCWSFATTGAMEGALFLKVGAVTQCFGVARGFPSLSLQRVPPQTGVLTPLSQQVLIDCSWGFGNYACDGGEEWRAYEWIKKHGGIASTESYGTYKGQVRVAPCHCWVPCCWDVPLEPRLGTVPVSCSQALVMGKLPQGTRVPMVPCRLKPSPAAQPGFITASVSPLAKQGRCSSAHGSVASPRRRDRAGLPGDRDRAERGGWAQRLGQCPCSGQEGLKQGCWHSPNTAALGRAVAQGAPVNGPISVQGS